ncbi:MAG: Acetyltransferase domain, partial [Frankiales bacterium]|nr:Acetyltransferase domain [Frankiales bacterium]
MLTLRALALDDLDLIEGWLAQPHVARWWLAGTSIS